MIISRTERDNIFVDVENSISIITTKSSLLIKSSLPDNRYKLFAIVRSYIKVSLFLLYLRCLTFVCIIGVVLVFSFPCNRLIFNKVNVTFRNSFFLVLFLLYFLLVPAEAHATSTATLIEQINVLALSSKINKDYCVR